MLEFSNKDARMSPELWDLSTSFCFWEAASEGERHGPLFAISDSDNVVTPSPRPLRHDKSQ